MRAAVPPVWLVPLGRTCYDAALSLQLSLHAAKAGPLRAARLRRADPPPPCLPDVILVTEHAESTYTMGRRDTSAGFKTDALRSCPVPAPAAPLLDLESSVDSLLRDPSASRSAEEDPMPLVRRISRGGGLTWHGPGQATVYPIVEFRRWWLQVPKDTRNPSPLHWLTECLEEAMVRTLADYHVPGAFTGKVGVWVRDAGAPSGEAKVGFVGLHAAEYVSMHGCSLNVTNSLSAFDSIEMCELPGKVPTTLSNARRETKGDVLQPTTSGSSLTALDVGARVGEHFVSRLATPQGLPSSNMVRRFESTEAALRAIKDTFS